MTYLKRFTASLLLLSLVLVSLPGIVLSAAPLENNAPDHVSGQIILKFKDNIGSAKSREILNNLGLSVKSEIKPLNLLVLNVPENSEEALVKALSKNPQVEFAELDALIKPNFIPNDPLYPDQYHLPQINASQAWDVTSGQGVMIGIADSGIDYSHSDLADNIRFDLAWNFIDNNNDITDVHGHGTLVAGTAGAKGNNNNQVTGVAFNADIVPLRISYYDATYGFVGQVSAMAQSLVYAADHGIKVVNMSYDVCGGYSSIISAANYLDQKGGVAVFGSGNSGSRRSYANTESMICVGAVQTNDAKAGFSSYGPYVDLSAPGTGILTTKKGNIYGRASGTSLASPVVAGVVALMYGVNPELTSNQVREILFTSAQDLGDAGWDEIYGWGRVDAARAVALTKALTQPTDTIAPTVVITSPVNNATVTGLMTISAKADDNVEVDRVEFYYNDRLIRSDNTAPYVIEVNTENVANGTHTLTAKAYDQAGNANTSGLVSINISNGQVDVTAPDVVIISPSDGTVLSGNTLTIEAQATDNIGVTAINIYINGNISATCYNITFCSTTVNTQKAQSGFHIIDVVALDVAGNSGSDQVTITKEAGSTTAGGNGRKK